jgi:group I intron endonuclease
MSNLTINPPTNLTQKPERTAYIYKATNLLDGMSYIGQSSDLIQRIRNHIWSNKDEYFHNALRKYGIENFEWEIIMSGPEYGINDVEIGYIVFENTKIPNGYNMTDGGEGASGHKVSDETKHKMRLARLGKKMSEESKLKCRLANLRSKHNLGKHLSDETKQKISDKHRGINNPMFGKHLSDETKQKISLSLCGKSRSEECIQNLRDMSNNRSKEQKDAFKHINIGRKHSEKWNEKSRLAKLGRHHSEETKKKMSEAHKGYVRTAEHNAKLAATKIGKSPSEETRRKISETLKANYERKMQESKVEE